ncbi:hypothetical protein N7462_010778 [Penicillium macrosclerotiorum]|uniref:uncharacterized protein n=1 Tax=Penicillium macrosclerotiorum TaxID=303699 RepID=UPI0025477E07|nr:uncharacterized protein N7462_010778 [Penicillium macrosclerotiorum]KAJ5669708.1 hypothetical protein N7462_010778 [Penicillium macrosclerotiorum]
MSQAISEFIYFKVKPEVKPEDPASDEGAALLRVFRATQQQSGHQSSAWGRAVEDENTLVWVVDTQSCIHPSAPANTLQSPDWTDARSSTTAAHLEPFLLDTRQPPTALYTTLNPPISSTDTLTKNPVTELCCLPFASNLTVHEMRQLNADLISFRTALVEQLPQAAGPRSWTMGHVDRPSAVEHVKSPSGHAVVHFIAVGWDSVEAHKRAKDTKEFVASIAPIREKMLSTVPGLEMKHVSFQKI